MSENQNQNDQNPKSQKEINSFIIATIRISNGYFLERIINSYENAKKEEPRDKEWSILKYIENEKDIKDCEIYINDEKINFVYYYEFKENGDYTIKYVF